MSSSIGRLALGLVGAAILAPFGMAAVGFSIGSAIGGFLFAPAGPNVEGPRLGDSDVSASTVGKIISEHYGTTRAAGNVFWSAGLKETKTKEKQDSGGKGGGGGGTVTSYTYSASFAIAFGRGPSVEVLRLWADGKLIYDVTGNGDVKNDKYSFRFRSGVDDPETEEGTIDPLIKESIHRRLQGLDDVNAGNQPQATYKTLDDLIIDVSTSGDARSAIYASYLTDLRDNAPAGTPKDYGFTPSYKEVTYIVFDDMPLEDFGNRIPNITAEIIWKTDAVVSLGDSVVETPFSETSPDTSVPGYMMGVDPVSRTALVINDTQLRRFSLYGASETYNQPVSFNGFTMERVLCATTSGDWIVRGTQGGSTRLLKLDNGALEPLGSSNTFNTIISESATYGCNAGVNGANDFIVYCDAAGNLGAANAGGAEVRNTVFKLGVGLGEGPMVYGGGEPGNTTTYWCSQNGTNFEVHKLGWKFGTSAPTSGWLAIFGILSLITSGTNDGTELIETSMDVRALAGGSVSGILYDFQVGRVYVIIRKSGGGGTIYEYDPQAAGTGGDPYLINTRQITGTPPDIDSGISRSGISSGQIVFANGNDAYVVELATGTEIVYTDVLSANVTLDAQVFEPNSGSLFTWLGGVPTSIRFNSLGGLLGGNDLASVISDICNNVGMLPDEYDISGVAGQYNVRGYTIARPATGRAVLESLFKAYFIEGIESDWKVKFASQQSSPIRTIQEDELGRIDGPTGDVAFLESRVPEQDLPSQVSVVYTDPDRDYQQGTGHYRRVSQPTASMYSKRLENIELPLVLSDSEGRGVAERILFNAWLGREQGKAAFSWTHIDLDPADVVQFAFNDGRTLTNRITQMQVGADFNIETASIRAGDPVYVPAEFSSVSTSSVPSTGVLTPAYAKMFVLDMPLLYDYHDLNRVSSRYYVAVGSDTTAFTSADLFQSLDGISFANFDSINADCTWGTIISGALPSPRALHSTDFDNTFTVKLSVDNGDLSSVSDDDIATGLINRGLIYNKISGDVEVIQFKNVTANADGTYTFDTLVRGRRGTDYAVGGHTAGEVFILVTDATVTPQITDLSSIGTTRYFKAVSRGGSIGGAPPTGELLESRDLKPYAPNYVRRTDNATDLTVLWNRRTRVGGQWNMGGDGIEPVPLNEDTEQYTCYLLLNSPTALEDFNPTDPATYVVSRQVTSEQAVFTAAELATGTYTLADTINVAVYQISAQDGRGFGRIVGLAP